MFPTLGTNIYKKKYTLCTSKLFLYLCWVGMVVPIHFPYTSVNFLYCKWMTVCAHLETCRVTRLDSSHHSISLPPSSRVTGLCHLSPGLCGRRESNPGYLTCAYTWAAVSPPTTQVNCSMFVAVWHPVRLTSWPAWSRWTWSPTPSTATVTWPGLLTGSDKKVIRDSSLI